MFVFFRLNAIKSFDCFTLFLIRYFTQNTAVIQQEHRCSVQSSCSHEVHFPVSLLWLFHVRYTEKAHCNTHRSLNSWRGWMKGVGRTWVLLWQQPRQDVILRSQAERWLAKMACVWFINTCGPSVRNCKILSAYYPLEIINIDLFIYLQQK